ILIGGDYQGGNGVRRATTTSIDAESSVSANAITDGDGGRIIVWSDQATSVSGDLAARGGANSGDGGFVETSSVGQLDIDGAVSVAAPAGQSGQWLLDPEDITIDEGMASSIEGTLNEGGHVTVKTADEGTGEGNITVAAPITKTEGEDASLTLDAHNRIDVDAPITSESNALVVNLMAGNKINVNAAIITNGGSVSQVINAPVGDLAIEEVAGEEQGEEVAEEVTEDPSEEVAADTAEEVTEESTEEVTEVDSEESTEQVSEEVAEESIEVVNEEVTEEIAEDPTEAVSGEVTESTSEEVADEVNDASVEQVAEETVEEVAQDVAEELSDDVSNTVDLTNDIQPASIDLAAQQSDPGVQINAIVDTNGGDILIDAGDTGTLMVVANLDASNLDSGETGGDITLLGENVGIIEEAEVNASGDDGGGTILIGGEQRGGGETPTSEFLYLGENASVVADGGTTGDGGTVILYAENTARVYGDISSTGGSDSGDGGFVETSGRQGFELLGNPDVSANNGLGGSWLIDPPTFIVSAIQAEANIDTSPLPVTFSPNFDPAVLGVSTLEAALGIGNVILETGFNGREGNVLIESAVTWASQFDLTIHGDDLISIQADITASDPGSVLNLLGAGGIELGTALTGGQTIQAGTVDLTGPLLVETGFGSMSSIVASALAADDIEIATNSHLELTPFGGGGPTVIADIGALNFLGSFAFLMGEADITLGDLMVEDGSAVVAFFANSVSLTGSGQVGGRLQLDSTDFNIESGVNVDVGISGQITLSDTADLTAHSGSTVTLNSDDITGGANIRNIGTGQFTLDPGSQLIATSADEFPFGSSISGNFTNNGQVDIQTGSLSLNSGLLVAETGNYNIADGAFLFLQNGLSNSGDFTGNGELHVSGGITDLTGGFDLTGRVRVQPGFMADTVLNISDSIGLAEISINSNPSDLLFSTVNLDGSSVSIDSVLELFNGGTLNLAPGVELPRVNFLSLGATEGPVEYMFEQANMDVGSIGFFGPATLGGATNFNAEFLNANFFGSTPPGTIGLSGSGTTTITNFGSIGSNNAVAGGFEFIVGNDATLVNQGFMDVVGPDMFTLNGNFINDVGGTLALSSDTGGDGLFSNLGTLNIQDGNSPDFAAQFSNEGLLSVGNLANITFTEFAPTQTAGEIRLTEGTVTSLNSPIVIEGGSITGSGEFVTDNLTLLDAVLAAGSSPGSITASNLTLTAGSTVDIELAGPTQPEFDQIVVSGATTLAGTLNVSLIDDYVPDAAAEHNIFGADQAVTGAFDAIVVDPEFVVTATAVPAGLNITVGPAPPPIVPPADPDPIVAEVAPVTPVTPDPIAPDAGTPEPVLPDPVVIDPALANATSSLDAFLNDFLESYEEVNGDSNIEASVRSGEQFAENTIETDEERLRRE
ncbi:MAG: hypothetical protein ACR2QW_12005, partial [bacterium]